MKENFFYATKAKAWRAETPEQLRELFTKASEQIPLDQILIQEIIPGDGNSQFSYCAFFRDGKALSTLMATRTRQHPREFGRAATYVESIDVPEIVEPSERFLKEINFYGIVEVEYKRDYRDGEYKLLDVNARTWGFQNLGASAGVDFCRMLWDDQMGKTVIPSHGRAGVGWLRLITDFPVAISDMAQGHLTLGSYLQSLGRTRAESVFCKDDPMPFFAEFAMLPYIIAKKYL